MENECMHLRAGFSWWEAWGPAIGVADGGQGGCSPHPPLPQKIPEKYFWANDT